MTEVVDGRNEILRAHGHMGACAWIDQQDPLERIQDSGFKSSTRNIPGV